MNENVQTKALKMGEILLTELLKLYEMSEWHLASVKVQLMASLIMALGGSIADRLIAMRRGKKEL